VQSTTRASVRAVFRGVWTRFPVVALWARRIKGIDRKTIRSYQRKFAEGASISPGVALTRQSNFPTPATDWGRGGADRLRLRAAPCIHRGTAAPAPASQRHDDLPGPGGPARLHRRVVRRLFSAVAYVWPIACSALPLRLGSRPPGRTGSHHAVMRHRGGVHAVQLGLVQRCATTAACAWITAAARPAGRHRCARARADLRAPHRDP
jgi:hypothetical protein